MKKGKPSLNVGPQTIGTSRLGPKAEKYTPGSLKKVVQKVIASDLKGRAGAIFDIVEAPLQRIARLEVEDFSALYYVPEIKKARCLLSVVPFPLGAADVLVRRFLNGMHEVCRNICGFKCNLPESDPRRFAPPEGHYFGRQFYYCWAMPELKAAEITPLVLASGNICIHCEKPFSRDV